MEKPKAIKARSVSGRFKQIDLFTTREIKKHAESNSVQDFRIVDLFSGCGGLSSGFLNAGFEIISAYDSWDKAIDCYSENFSHPAKICDLSNVDESIQIIKKMNPDAIIGGPPCQDFSHAGKRTEGKRANLTVCYANIVSAIQPKWFLMENVDRAMKSDSYSKAKEILKKAGYGLSERVLDASFCGVPQKRKRLFCVGCLGAEDQFLDEFIDASLSKSAMTLRNYFGSELGLDYYYRHPRNYNRRGIFSIDEPSPTIRGVNRPVPKGYPGHPQDATPLSSALRNLSTRERSLIQTFPDSFIWKGSKTEMETMIGNAVPVKLAEFIARTIKEYFNSIQ